MPMNSDWKSALSKLLPEDGPHQDETAPAEAAPAEAGLSRQSAPLRVELDRKRAGKTATIISGFTISDSRVEDLARSLKQRLGAGGSARGGEILIQGDRLDAVAEILRGAGYKCKTIR